jgi:hypothetical protein
MIGQVERSLYEHKAIKTKVAAPGVPGRYVVSGYEIERPVEDERLME